MDPVIEVLSLHPPPFVLFKIATFLLRMLYPLSSLVHDVPSELCPFLSLEVILIKATENLSA